MYMYSKLPISDKIGGKIQVVVLEFYDLIGRLSLHLCESWGGDHVVRSVEVKWQWHKIPNNTLSRIVNA